MTTRQGLAFLRIHRWRVLAISALLLVPCFWHKSIEAADLPSHTYNAWLAQLIEKGEAPGLYLVRQSNNILFDVSLAELGKLVGLFAAEKILVAASVLIFFWAAFVFITAATLRPPWVLVPAIAMITYGWTFYAGFMNFYLSLGFAFFALALVWRGRGPDWIIAAVFAALVFLAHPMGFLFLIATGAYLKLAEILHGWLRWLLFASAFLVVLAAHFYVLRFRTVGWNTPIFYQMNGADQLVLFSDRYVKLAWVVFIFGTISFLYGAIREWKTTASPWAFRAPLELWAVLVFTAAMIPEVIWLPQYGGVAGLLISRLTSISAVIGLCVLAWVKPRVWHLAAFSVCALVFFTWTYQDTRTLNQMERQAEALVSTLPYGRRVIETIAAPVDSRIWFINHIVDRACIGRCFAYANYEPSSRQFRVRVRSGSPLVTASDDDSEDMESGDYEVLPEDLPMNQIFQCDEQDLTKLCIRELTAGEKNGRLGHRPANR